MVINDLDQEAELPSLITFNGVSLKNTTKFKYLGLMILNKDLYLQHRISSALSKFTALKHLLTDQQITTSTRLKFLNSFVRSRLTYSAATWDLTETQIASLEVIWLRLLRRMVKGGFKRKEKFKLVFTNQAIYRITAARSISSYLRQ